jgi:hypothetical protein
MNHKKRVNADRNYSPNVRAEDGLQQPGGWRTLRDAVLIPLGFILAPCLLILFMSHSALAQTGGGRIVETNNASLFT